jgi:hypothetical protein
MHSAYPNSNYEADITNMNLTSPAYHPNTSLIFSSNTPAPI